MDCWNFGPDLSFQVALQRRDLDAQMEVGMILGIMEQGLFMKLKLE